MSELARFINDFTIVTATPAAELEDTESMKFVDLCFFRVGADPRLDADRLRELIAQHRSEYGADDKTNPIEPGEYSYLQLGAWLDSQELALQLMGLGAVLGLWKLLTPMVFAPIFDLSQEQIEDMVGKGYITIHVPKEKAVVV